MWVRTLSDIRDEYKLTHAYCVKKINGQNLFNLSNSQAFLNLNDNLRTILNVECAEQVLIIYMLLIYINFLQKARN